MSLIDVLQLFFPPTQPTTIGINTLIAGLGIWAIRLWYSTRGLLTEDRAALKTAQDAVHGTPPTAEYGRRLAGIRSGTGGIAKVARALTGYAEVGEVPVDEHLTELFAAAYEAHLSNLRWIGSSAVMLGLFGTLVGMTTALPSTGAIATGDFGASSSATTDVIRAILGGLSTAFSTTLLGIIVAVPAGWVSMKRRQEVLALTDEVESLVLLRVMPLFRAAPADELARATQVLAKASDALVQMQSGLAESLDDVIRTVRMQGTALAKTVEDTVGALTKEAHERGTALVSTVDRSLTDLVAETREGHGALIAGYTKAHTDLVRVLGQPEANIQPIMGSLHAMQEAVVRFERSAVTLERMTPAIEEAISRQVDRQTKDLHTSLHGYTELLTSGVARQNDLIDRTLGQITSAIASQDAVVKASLVNVANAVSSGMTGALVPLAETAGELKAAADAQRQVASALGGLDELRLKLDRLLAVLERSSAAPPTGAFGPELTAFGEAVHAMRGAAADLAGAAKELKRPRSWKFWGRA